MRNIAIITARSGSKGLKDKNILPLNNKPLLAWSIDAAKESEVFDLIHLSTDSQEYAEIGKEYGANVAFLRNKDLSSDSADSWSVLRWVIREFEKIGQVFDTVTLLQPTSPLRNAEDLQKAMHLLQQKNARAIVSVCEMEHSPLWANTLPPDGNMKHFLKPELDDSLRQNLETYYRLNGAIYMMHKELLMSRTDIISEAYAYIMPPERSIDIDTLLDFQYAELILNSQNKKQPIENR